MPKVKLYTIKDLVPGECGPVFSAVNDGVAIRQTCSLLHDVVDPFDYLLVCVGTFDTADCLVTEPEYREIDFIHSLNHFLAQLEAKRARETFIQEVK